MQSKGEEVHWGRADVSSPTQQPALPSRAAKRPAEETHAPGRGMPSCCERPRALEPLTRYCCALWSVAASEARLGRTAPRGNVRCLPSRGRRRRAGGGLPRGRLGPRRVAHLLSRSAGHDRCWTRGCRQPAGPTVRLDCTPSSPSLKLLAFLLQALL